MTNNLAQSALSFLTRSTLYLVCRAFAPLHLLLPLPLRWPLPMWPTFHRVRFLRVLSEVIHNPTFVRVQVRLDDCSQLGVVALELLRVHQQVVSEFGWCFAQHHADFHIIIQTLTQRDSRRRPPNVPTFSTLSQILPRCHRFTAATQLATLRIFDPLSLLRFSPPTVSRLDTRFYSALVAPFSNLIPWSVSPTKRTVCGSTFA